MQGFLETAFGLKPVNLTNIQAVTYYTNSDIQLLAQNDQLISATTGSLVIEYIGNATGYRDSGGNIIIGLDYYKDQYYPVERFWAWVRDVSAGSVTKTFNSYLNNGPVYGVTTFAVNDFSPVEAYGIKLDDTQTIEDGCGLIFKNEVYPELGLNARPNYLTFVTDGDSTFPEIGTRVFLSQTQGYNPNSFGGELPEGFPGEPEFVEFEKVVETANASYATSPLVADGRYMWLDGTPAWDSVNYMNNPPTTVTNAQAGMLYLVTIKSGRIHDVAICPADFDASNAVKDIPGKLYSPYKVSVIESGVMVPLETVASANCACWAYSEPQINTVVGSGEEPPSDLINAGVQGAQTVCTAGSYGGLGLTVNPNPWFDVTLGFTEIPEAVLSVSLDGGVAQPELNCPTSGQGSNPSMFGEEGFQDAEEQFSNLFGLTVPNGAKVWILSTDGLYRPFVMSSGYEIKAQYREYEEDPASEVSYPGNLIPTDTITDIAIPRDLASDNLAVPAKTFKGEPSRNGEAAFSITTVVPANPEAGIPVELTKTCYYFGYDPAVVAQHQGETLFNQFTVDSQGKINVAGVCEKSVMEFAGKAVDMS